MSLHGQLLRGLDSLLLHSPEKLWPAPRVDGQALSPLLQLMLRLRELRAQPLPQSLSPAAAREQLRQDVLPLRKSYRVGRVHEVLIELPERELRARHYQPRERGLPILLLYFHGGGFVVGDLDTHDDVCRLLCREAGIQVLSLDYRLAPEHPCPAALEDAAVAMAWLRQHAADFGVLPAAIAVGGDSAGGNLATVLAQQLSRDGHPALAQLLIYPGTDLLSELPSRREFAQGYFLDAPLRDWFYQHYLSGGVAPEDPRVSPLRGHLLGRQASALVVTAAFDMLRDEGEAYAQALARTGARVEAWRVPGLGHGFVNLVGVHHASEQAVIDMAQRFRRLCASLLS